VTHDDNRGSVGSAAKAIRDAGIGSRKKGPRRSGAEGGHIGRGASYNKPHPFTFAEQHVRIGAAAPMKGKCPRSSSLDGPEELRFG